MTYSKYDHIFSGQYRADANETAITIKALESLESRVYKVQYPDLLTTQLLPLDTSDNTGAKTTAFDEWDRTGKAKIEHEMSNSAPVIEVNKQRTAQNIFSARAAYLWTLQDIRAAAMAGVPLNMERAEAVREEIEREVDRINAVGDTENGLQGFLNHSAAPSPVSPITGSWVLGTVTTKQILDDLNKLVDDIVTDTKNIAKLTPDTMILPVAQYTIANSTLNANTDKSALRIFLDNSPYIKQIVPWHYAADPAGTGPRAVAYRRDPKVVSKVIPQLFEFLSPFQKSSTVFEQEGHMRTAGVKMRYPVAVRYMDGI